MFEQPDHPQRREEDEEDVFLRERMERWNGSGSRREPFDPLFAPRPYKRKWIAGLLSFLIPGTGQLYLGLMQRGMGMMLLFIMNIFAIVFFAVNAETNIPLIVLFSLLVPVIYFYNIFDALQQTDRVNGYDGPGPLGRTASADPLAPPEARRSHAGGRGFGYLLIGAGALLFLTAGKPEWLNRLMELLGTSAGALVLIGAGLYMLIKETMKK
ncbi:hypothetical protein [Paenibacillus mucilaginosus]|uniref:TM2 domain-containing protein n=3 Tax=Paenibacillus mucilaginosus TaxID=61624 RepID=H6NBR2_9BACL|nr:hypothetical protein [Paenibacillus mucilaginosus]AEI39620.1 conserved hypothetical protein [Paenibacillus mucilaginosus KNP414]AFC27863.1 hypothetical protein PM3016_919 [Paenibacillus mucilaginosus 3016]AFH60017.1 hypothetical protein B2K_04660 [Paenibacillus mucilaginosus K02]MCG7218007.1 hypothetical protein [Paenibacillus mucilaginosus]WDM28564.1 hypothetical protein KCX80_04785 [Paenibacillus mucilaginosus]